MSLNVRTADPDLAEAEQLCSDLAAALRAAVDHCDFADVPAVLEAVETWEHYCRPSCGFLEDGRCGVGEGCSCPCQRTDPH